MRNHASAGRPLTTAAVATAVSFALAATAACATPRLASVSLRFARPTAAAHERQFEMLSDGGIVANGEVFAHLGRGGTAGNVIGPIISVAVDGAILFYGRRTDLRMAPNGDVQSVGGANRGAHLAIGADGALEDRHPDGTIERSDGRFEHIPAGARATAMVTYLTVMAGIPGVLRGSVSQRPILPIVAPTPSEATLALDVNLRATARGFPAVSPDGASVAVADIVPDAPQRAPNLVVRWLDARSGAELRSLVVLSVAESARGVTDALRVATAQRLTQAQNAVRAFRPLDSFHLTRRIQPTPHYAGRAGNAECSFDPATRTLSVAVHYRVSLHNDAVLPPAAPSPAHRGAGCNAHEPVVRGAWLLGGGAFYRLEHLGTHQCPAPQSSFGVLQVRHALGG